MVGTAQTLERGTLVPVVSTHTARSTEKLPFTFEQVVRFFETTLDTQPTITSSKAVTFHSSGPGHEFMFVIREEGADIEVIVATVDDCGISYTREFFECALLYFQRNSAALYVAEPE